MKQQQTIFNDRNYTESSDLQKALAWKGLSKKKKQETFTSNYITTKWLNVFLFALDNILFFLQINAHIYPQYLLFDLRTQNSLIFGIDLLIFSSFFGVARAITKVWVF